MIDAQHECGSSFSPFQVVPLVTLRVVKNHNFSLLFSRIISPKMMIALGEYLGVDTCMTSFTGRVKAEELQMETKRKEQ
jgi:all-trans-retinol dehydrogenase (NAD+)